MRWGIQCTSHEYAHRFEQKLEKNIAFLFSYCGFSLILLARYYPPSQRKPAVPCWGPLCVVAFRFRCSSLQQLFSRNQWLPISRWFVCPRSERKVTLMPEAMYEIRIWIGQMQLMPWLPLNVLQKNTCI